MKKTTLHRLIITVLALLCYANTLTLHYALDDRMVILESKYTIKGGWDSVKAIFSEDTFTGYFGADHSIVAGGRYRPMSQLTYMIEFQLFGKSIKEKIGDLDDYYNLHNAKNEDYFYETPLPFVNHLISLLYYILLCLLIYEVLARIFPQHEGKKWFQSLPFLATLLFALHPIHTEVVANVKGRDEIFAMLGAFAALWCSLKYVDTRKWYWLVVSLLAFTFGIFSKENAITFLAVLPLALFYYKNENKRTADYFITLIPLVLGSVFFVWVRYKVLGSMMPPDLTSNILNNPYVHSTRAQQIATVLITWGIYLKLLFFPHPLTHDYYPHQITITDFSNPLVWLLLAGSIALVVYGIWKLKQKTVPAFGILYFIITFSIVSNLLFNVGTFMNERFVFMSSIGFTLIVGWWLYLLATSSVPALQKTAVGVTAVISLLFGIKTFTRNFTWKDDFTLFLTDVKTSENSIKCNISAGGSCLQIWKKSHKERDKRDAYRYLEKALRLDDHALNAYLLLSELAYLDENPDLAYQAAYNATLIDPENPQGQNLLNQATNMQKAHELDPVNKLLDEGKVDEAWREVNKILEKEPNNIVAKNVKGNVLGRGYGRLDDAIKIFEEIVAEQPDFSSAWENMGIAYAIKRDFTNAERCLLHALELSPDNDNIKLNLYYMYKDKGDEAEAEKYK
ncbi:MAG: glycosyltransferase family 39 protein [Bacteroidales bacterium]|nr:glycosyltransferase family 39 protein [Bacteroidales bacterium]